MPEQYFCHIIREQLHINFSKSLDKGVKSNRRKKHTISLPRLSAGSVTNHTVRSINADHRCRVNDTSNNNYIFKYLAQLIRNHDTCRLFKDMTICHMLLTAL